MLRWLPLAGNRHGIGLGPDGDRPRCAGVLRITAGASALDAERGRLCDGRRVVWHRRLETRQCGGRLR